MFFFYKNDPDGHTLKVRQNQNTLIKRNLLNSEKEVEWSNRANKQPLAADMISLVQLLRIYFVINFYLYINKINLQSLTRVGKSLNVDCCSV